MGKASAEYYNLEKVAEVLSMSAAEVNRLREQGKLRGLRDGNTWKFFKEEVHTYLAEKIKSRGGASGGQRAGESDFDLQGIASSSSFDLLMEDAALPGDSDLVAVAPVHAASDLDLAALDQDDELALAEETHISALTVPKKSQPKEEPQPQEELSSVIIVEDDNELALAEETHISALSVQKKPQPKVPQQKNELSSVVFVEDDDSSALLLAHTDSSDALGDKDSVLSPSGSSPQLNLTSDSGFDVLIAGDDDDFMLGDRKKASASGDVVQEFSLEPSPNILGGDDSESSSQVIAIDAFAGLGPDIDPFAKQDDDFGAFSGFGSDIQQPSQTPAAGGDTFGTSDVFSASVAPAVSVTTKKPTAPAEDYSTGALLALVFALVFMLPAGLMLIDTMVHVWSWGEPFILNSILMSTFSGLFGL